MHKSRLDIIQAKNFGLAWPGRLAGLNWRSLQARLKFKIRPGLSGWPGGLQVSGRLAALTRSTGCASLEHFYFLYRLEKMIKACSFLQKMRWKKLQKNCINQSY